MKTIVLGCILISLFTCCNRKGKTPYAHSVFVNYKNNHYTLYRFGKPYVIKGAGGFENLKALSDAGGNSIRIWDTTNLATILKTANQYHLTVVVGLPFANSEWRGYYDDTSKINAQFKSLSKIINTYKNDPAILMWCVGNELDFPYSLSYRKFYNAFDDVVDMIHRDDPDHPVTTTMVNFQRKNIFNIKLRTNVDIISFNLFGKLKFLSDDLANFSWFWNGPYLISEWGIDGPWAGSKQTAWGAYLEPTSNAKAREYLLRYQKEMPTPDPRFLGSFVFYWGQKQETTPTWFSLFDENGNKTDAVATMQYLWQGKWPLHQAPQIKYMLVDGKGGQDNLLYKPKDHAQATLLMSNDDSAITKITWQIYKEDWYKKDNINDIRKKYPVPSLITNETPFKANFIVPERPGPYRIFATVYDSYGNVSTCNTPFYVVPNSK